MTKTKGLDKRIQALETKTRIFAIASKGCPYWIDENEPYEQRMMRYRAYFEAL